MIYNINITCAELIAGIVIFIFSTQVNPEAYCLIFRIIDHVMLTNIHNGIYSNITNNKLFYNEHKYKDKIQLATYFCYVYIYIADFYPTQS